MYTVLHQSRKMSESRFYPSKLLDTPLSFEIFFLRERFLYDYSTSFSSYFENALYFFTPIEYGKTQTRFFSALGSETEEQIKLAKNKSHFDL